MKQICTVIVLGILMSPGLSITIANAQDQTSSSSQGTMQSRSPDEVVNSLATKLNLTDDQKSQIKPIIADRQQQIAAMKSDTSMRPRQKMRKMKSIFEESDKKIEAILNDQQKQQYIAMEQQMRDQMRQRMQNRGNMD